jgi:hypothetical protein
VFPGTVRVMVRVTVVNLPPLWKTKIAAVCSPLMRTQASGTARSVELQGDAPRIPIGHARRFKCSP